MQGGMKKSRFSTNISLYLRNDARQSHSYCVRRIGNRTQGFKWYQWPLTQISRSRYYLTSNNSNTVQDRAICTADQLESRIWSIERRHYQWPWTTPTLSFKVTLFFDAEYLRNGTRYKHSFNRILIGTYTCPIQQCYAYDLEWLSKLFNDTKRRAVSLRQLSFLLSNISNKTQKHKLPHTVYRPLSPEQGTVLTYLRNRSRIT